MEQKTYEEILTENNKLKNEIEKLQAKVLNQELQINWFNRYFFGAKNETVKKEEENIVDGEQCSFLSVPEDIKKEVEEKTEEITVYRKKNNKKGASGIKKAALKDVEVITEEYKLNEEQSKCPVCGNSLMEQLGKRIVRQEIEYIPAKLILKNYVSYTYKCEKCGTEDSEKETATIVKAKTPVALLSHSFASPSLASEVIYQKYYMGAPLYRQEKMWDDLGLVLPRNMMANWCIKISEYYLEPLYNLMLKKIKGNSLLLHCDETTIQVNKEQNKKSSSNSYMWVLASGELEESKGIVFKYSSSRSSEVAKEFLKNYKNILVTDGYAGYNALDSEILHAECWAHARRKFYDSIPLVNKELDKSSLGYEGVLMIDKLFKAENEIDRKIATETDQSKKLSLKKELRNKILEPILQKFYEWVCLTNEKYIVNKKLKEALIYATNQREELSQFLNDGRIPLTNSKCERAIRPFAVHRKNWLFADTVNGAKANAVYYSFIESAKANNLNIYKYIKYLLEELPQLEGPQAEENIEKYLPWSKDLPKDILNFEGTYKELEFQE